MGQQNTNQRRRKLVSNLNIFEIFGLPFQGNPPRSDRSCRISLPILAQRLIPAVANLSTHEARSEDRVEFQAVVIELHVYLCEATRDIKRFCPVIGDTVESKTTPAFAAGSNRRCRNGVKWQG